MSERTGCLVVDADGHVIEPTRLWWDYLDPEFRSRVVPDDERLGEVNGALMPLVDGHPSFAGTPVMIEQLRTGSTTDLLVDASAESGSKDAASLRSDLACSTSPAWR